MNRIIAALLARTARRALRFDVVVGAVNADLAVTEVVHEHKNDVGLLRLCVRCEADSGGGVLRGAPTPRIDKLAAEGMRLCDPDRTLCDSLGHTLRAASRRA